MRLNIFRILLFAAGGAFVGGFMGKHFLGVLTHPFYVNHFWRNAPDAKTMAALTAHWKAAFPAAHGLVSGAVSGFLFGVSLGTRPVDVEKILVGISGCLISLMGIFAFFVADRFRFFSGGLMVFSSFIILMVLPWIDVKEKTP